MRRIYLDNAATSFPKAPGTGEAIRRFIDEDGVSLYRTASKKADDIWDSIFDLREMLSKLYHYPHPECIAFTMNVTEALNFMIKGVIPESGHAVVTSSEHNAVMRPLSQIRAGVSRIPSDRYGYSDMDRLEELIQRDTKAIIINAASNVSGAVQDIAKAGEIAEAHGIPLIIDAAQASPHVDIDMEKLNAAAVCFTGHKSFLGPQGTGGVIIRRDIAERIQPLIAGGTGTESDNEDIPSTVPERLRAGTENLPGLIGLQHAVAYTISHLESIKERMEALSERLYEGLMAIEGIAVHGPSLDTPRTAVFSITAEGKDPADIAAILLDRGNIETRVGLHCAPSSHRTLGTFPGGTLRISPGPFTEDSDIDTLLCLLREIINE